MKKIKTSVLKALQEEGKNFEEYARLEAINMRNNLSM